MGGDYFPNQKIKKKVQLVRIKEQKDERKSQSGPQETWRVKPTYGTELQYYDFLFDTTTTTIIVIGTCARNIYHPKARKGIVGGEML